MFIVCLHVPSISSWSLEWELQSFYYFDPEVVSTISRLFDDITVVVMKVIWCCSSREEETQDAIFEQEGFQSIRQVVE